MISAPQFPGLECRVRRDDVRYEGPIAAAVAAKLLDPARVPVSSAKWSGVFRFGRQVETQYRGAVAEVMLDHGKVVIYLFSHLVAGVAVEPASPVHLPRIEGGNVVMLPTAAAAPVANPQRRGRYPKGVTPISVASCARFQREQRQRLISAKQTALRGFEEHASMCRAEIVQLEQLQKGGGNA